MQLTVGAGFFFREEFYGLCLAGMSLWLFLGVQYGSWNHTKKYANKISVVFPFPLKILSIVDPENSIEIA